MNKSMLTGVIVFAGGGVGAVLRHSVNLAAARWLGAGFPWGVLLINVTGSTLMGLAAGFFALKADASWAAPLRLFLATGVLGGYTTFSAFSLDAVTLWERGEGGAAFAYVAGSVGFSLLGLVLGLGLARALA